MKFKEIDTARKILGLDESATLEEIRKAYRKLVLKYHPDRGTDKNRKEYEEMFKKITNAYNTIMVYCTSYKYSFKKEDVEKTKREKDIDEELIRNFYDNWLGDTEE